MKEKVLKYIIELVFIFIIPLALLATCFKQEKVYDENNNEVEKYISYDNGIFREYNDNLEYINILNYNQYFSSYDSSFNVIIDSVDNNIRNVRYVNNSGYLGCSFNPNYTDHYYIIYFTISNLVGELKLNYFYNNSFHYILNITSNGNYILKFQSHGNGLLGIYKADSSEATFTISNFGYTDIDLMFGDSSIITTNIFKSIINVEEYHEYVDSEIINYYSNDLLSTNYEINYTWYYRIFNQLFDTLQINNNYILQIIITYTLLLLVMWFIWHILYLPLDFICSKLLFDRVDK